MNYLNSHLRRLIVHAYPFDLFNCVLNTEISSLAYRSLSTTGT